MDERRLWETWRTLDRIFRSLDSALGTGVPEIEACLDEAMEAIEQAQGYFSFDREGHIYVDG